MELNKTSLDTLCAALCYAMGVEPPAQAAPANRDLCGYVDRVLGGKKADRLLMYNPDAIAQWIYEKYPDYFTEMVSRTELEIPFRTVMPSVTPVCFGTMYTGAQPAVHGIQEYEKPVIKIDTFFDALIRAEKKPVILSRGPCSMSKIFLEREMDYFIYDNYEDINAQAAQVMLEDRYDVVVIYNGNYDSRMHRVGPEDPQSLAEARCTVRTFGLLDALAQRAWKDHDTLVGFAMDHGCHEIEPDENNGRCGSHGLDMPEDLNIFHRFQIHPAQKSE